MNGKALLVILVIAVLLLAVYFMYFAASNNDDEIIEDEVVDINNPVGVDDNLNNPPVTVSGQGIVAAINAEGVAVDGPYLITTQSSSTTTPLVIAVPSMGINLCTARAAIADMASLEVGDTIEVRGYADSNGNIVPCEGTDHYLRVTSEA